jgi:succinyl-diaminopimelate desuccinylase
VNHRVAPDRTRDEAVAWLRHYLGELVDANDDIEVIDWAPSATPDLGNAHLARLVALSGAAPRAKVGWTDVATFRDRGVPATNFGVGDPLLAHRRDEFITAAQLSTFVEVLGEWLRASPRS